MAGRGAWDHQLLRLHEPIPERPHVTGGFRYSTGGCKRCKRGRRPPAEWILTYRYVTGRGGRVSSARLPLCEVHARSAAERAGITFPVDAVAAVAVVFDEARDQEDPAGRLRTILDAIRSRPELFDVCLVCKRQRKICRCEVEYAAQN